MQMACAESRARRGRWWRPGGAAVVGLLTAALCVGLFVRHNDFPIDYHPDALGKVVQLSAQRWNFRHPHGLMTLTRAIEPAVSAAIGPVVISDDRWWFEPALPADAGAWLRAGRVASALCAAGTVAAMGWLAWLQYGRAAGLLTALLVMWSHALMTRAHYLKEDTALVLGLALVGLGVTLWSRRPTWGRAIGLGVACGVASSAKYIGAAAVPAAAAFVLLAGVAMPLSWKRRAAMAGVVLLATAAVFLAVNFEMLRDPAAAWAGLRYEAEHVTSSHFGLVPAHPLLYYASAMTREVALPVLLLGIVGGVWLAASWRRLDAAQRAVFVFPLLYTAVIAMGSAVHMDRYLLPLVVAWHLLAAVALVRLASWLPAALPTRQAAGAIAAAAVVAVSVGHCLDLDDALELDSRRQLNDWIATHMPRNANIVAEAYARIRPASARAGGHSITPSFHAVRLGDLDTLARSGYTHVVVCDMAYGRYISGDFVGDPTSPTEAGEFALMTNRYRQLFARAELVWSSPPPSGQFEYADPQIHVFRLPRSGQTHRAGEWEGPADFADGAD